MSAARSKQEDARDGIPSQRQYKVGEIIKKALVETFERVEIRDVFSLEPKLQKARLARNPKTNEKIYVNEKYTILFKTSKFWSKKINEEK